MVGAKFSELGQIIKYVNNKERIGVCLDTCHMFAAGYDIRTKEGWEESLKEFDREIGLNYLKAMHLNDSKFELGSRKDRHANIGLGHIGITVFKCILTDDRFKKMPLILETPWYVDRQIPAYEIYLLNCFAVTRDEVALTKGLEDLAIRIDIAQEKTGFFSKPNAFSHGL